VSSPSDRQALRARLWASRWPEVAWLLFAFGNLGWMVLMPSWSMLPYHLTWMSLLLLYGLGVRTWSRMLTWCLLAPVMTATGLLFLEARVRGPEPFDELIELPMMVVMLYVMTRLTDHRKAAMDRMGALSRHNFALLERQRTFVQNASHELRTPITIALAHAELLAPAVTAADTKEDVAIVVDELGRLRGLVDQLLLLATAEQDALQRPSPTRLSSVLDELLRRWRPLRREWLVCNCADVSVLADQDRLMLAVDALVDNAVRFTEDDDRIELSVERHGREVAVTVADSGPGIPEDQLESVFERFDGSAPRQRSARNFGLGLAIVRAVVEAHGGRVSAARAALGGAAVTLWLPLYDEAAEASVSRQGGPVPVAPQPA